MEIRCRHIDKVYVERQNGEHKHRIQHYKDWVEKVTSDATRRFRLQEQECVVCFHTTRIGCAAVTQWMCSFCGKQAWHGNTNVDVLCKDCAKEHGLCKHCGADIDLKNRRKRELPRSGNHDT